MDRGFELAFHFHLNTRLRIRQILSPLPHASAWHDSEFGKDIFLPFPSVGFTGGINTSFIQCRFCGNMAGSEINCEFEGDVGSF
jgi:hypothetical protein